LFKIQMGLSGVGTPDATYAVSCYPAKSTKLNRNEDEPWTRSRRRPLAPWNPDDGAWHYDTCFKYTIRAGDTVDAIVDHFGLDMREVCTDAECDAEYERIQREI
jgi:hypothetical protein